LDLYHGKILQVNKYNNNNTIDVSVDIEANGYGAVLMIISPSQHIDPQLYDLMQTMKLLTQFPIEHYSSEWQILNQKCIVNQGPKTGAGNRGMIEIPSIPNFNFVVHGIEIEGWNLTGLDFQYTPLGEAHPNRYHNLSVSIDRFWIDKYPVTNQNFSTFLRQSGYTPRDSFNFLKNWNWNSKTPVPPPGWENKPVTWVSLNDARSYCKYYQARLPNEWEWQYAAQGTNYTFVYPWGEKYNASNVPIIDTSRGLRAPDDVGTHPGGASSFGVEDLVGLVWQYTNEFEDEHTRAASLRGGSYYKPQGSQWYFPQAYRLDEHGKYLLMSDSYDRAATLGFRCVKQ